jgi:hypothetical protein
MLPLLAPQQTGVIQNEVKDLLLTLTFTFTADRKQQILRSALDDTLFLA